MFLKPYEMEVTERPYHIFWHGVFLRSYADKEEFDKNLLWYKSFLLCILLILLASWFLFISFTQKMIIQPRCVIAFRQALLPARKIQGDHLSECCRRYVFRENRHRME